MSLGYGVGDIMAISGLAFKVYTACKDAPGDYRNISDEVKSLHIIINRAAQHFESTTLSSSSRQEGQEILKGCRNVLEDLDCLIGKYNSLASARSHVVQRVRLGAGLVLGTEDIATLRARLTSNTTLLNGFIQSCDSDKIQARLDNILGLHRTTSSDSIVSLAGSINTKKAYKKFIKDLLAIGVTADMINEKEKEIKDIFSPQQAVASNQMDDSTSGDQTQLPEEPPQFPEAGNSSNAETSAILIGNKPKSRSRFPWVRPPIDFLVGPRMLAAAEAGEIQRLISTLEYVRNINFVDPWRATALHKAAARGHRDIVELLLSKGASIEAMDQVEDTALHEASSNGHTSTVELLLTKGASVEATDKYKDTPLHKAARYGHPITVELLLTEGASVEAAGKYSNTPLHDAARNGYTRTVELLLAKGALVEAMDNTNSTPLHYASQRGHTSTVEVLLAKGASVQAASNNNETPLHQAARNGHTGAVELLLAKGASIEALNIDNNTPLDLAKLNRRAGTVTLLENQDAELGIPGTIQSISG